MNRIRPSSSRAAFCIPPASLNSLANAEAIELDGEENGFGQVERVADHEGDRHGFTQRPAEPQHDAAITPDLVYGSTTFQTTSRWCCPDRRRIL